MKKKETNPSINRLMTAVVQEQDAEVAVRKLSKHGYLITKLPSLGGFLGRRNATLLLGLSQDQEESAIQDLKKSCRSRVEYVTVPLEGNPIPLPAPMPITVGGATIFCFEIERFEVIS